MKKLSLFVVLIVSGLASIGQTAPSNVDIGLFNVGANGSNAGLGALAEVALRIKPGGVGYAAAPLVADAGIYIKAPKTDFTIGDVVQIMEVNSSIYGSSATNVVLDAGVLDIPQDAANLYFPVVLNSSGGMNLSSLSAGTNAWSFAFTFRFNNAKTQAQINKLRIVDDLNNDELSVFAGGEVRSNILMLGDNQLTLQAFTVLPVRLLNFSGYKNGTKNTLQWATSSEENNVGFEVQRSANGVDYSPIGFVNTLAQGGNSVTELNYVFNDNSPVVSKKQFYRLLQKDFDGNSKQSNVVLIKGDKSTEFLIDGLFPNPARDRVNVIVNAPQRQDITLLVMDVTGKTVKQKQANVSTGSNTVPIEVGELAGGSYFVKILCKTDDCETPVAKFNKQ